VGAKNSAAIAALELWWTRRARDARPSRRRHPQKRQILDQAHIENRIKNLEIPAISVHRLEIGETFAASDSRKREANQE